MKKDTPIEPRASVEEAPAEVDGRAPAGIETAVVTTLLVIAVLIVVESLRLGVGELSRPGPGFFPLLAAGGMVVTLAGVLAAAVRRRAAERHADAVPSPVVGPSDGEEDAQSSTGPLDRLLRFMRRHWGQATVVLIFVIIGAYTALIPLIGYGVSTALAAFALLLLQGWRGWKPVVASIAIAAAAAGVFVFLLGAPLPRLFGIV